MKLDLDMRHLTDGSLHGRVLEFSTKIQTHSINHGTYIIKSPLTLQSEASLLLNGSVKRISKKGKNNNTSTMIIVSYCRKAIEKNYYLFNLDSDQSNIIFQHVYQILKFGATPLEEARLIINLPTTINDSDPLVLLYEPRVGIRFIL